MDLDLDHELEELRNSICRLASDHRSADGACDNSSAFWRSFVDSGWPALALPEDRGGADGSLAACGVVLEEVARNGFVTPFLSSLVISGGFLARALPKHDQQDLFGAMISGDARIAFAFESFEVQSKGQSGAMPSVIAAEQAGTCRFDGQIEHVIGGGEATHFIVVGRGSEGDQVVALIASDQPGLSLRRFPTWRGEDAADMVLDCIVSETQIIARASNAETLVADALRQARVASCWEALGMIQCLLEDTIEHVRTRVQFGGSMANLQVIRHRIAEMSVHQRESQMVVRAATMLAQDANGERIILAARARVAEAARYVGRQAVQLHGAMGTTQESRVAALFRRLTAFDHLYGGTASVLSRYADTLIGTETVRVSALLS